MSTALFFAPAQAHDKDNHPENARRLQGMLSFLESNHGLGNVGQGAAEAATVSQLRRVHSASLIERVRQASARGGGMLDGDTYTTRESYALALLAAGSCCAAVDMIMAGEADNGLALVRPPGHHAERARAGGFCLFNNVAVAARQAQVVHGVERVLILDFDVHHGNGTQEIFYRDGHVLFVSLHMFYPYFYPGTGAAGEVGEGAGRGTTLNVPFPPHVGDRGYAQALEQLVISRVRQFQPELILVSAGFDAHWRDPLASAALSLTGYAHLSRSLCLLAEELCHGRILFVLEGGYLLEALRYGVLNVLHALTGRDQIDDPLGPAPGTEVAVSDLLQRLQRYHLQ